MKYIYLAAGILAILFSFGCATVREARQAQKGVKKELLPGEYTVTSAEVGIVVGKKLTLAELEEIALKYNPDILQAQLQVSQAELALQNARAGYSPTLTAGVGHQRSTSNTDRHSQSTGNEGSYSGSLGLSVTVFDFGRTSANIRKAQMNLVSALQNWKYSQTTVRFNVRKAFFELMRAFDLHAVAMEAVQQYKEHLDQMTAMREVGEGKAYDVTKAEVDYNEAVLKEITTAHDVETGWADLNQVLGLAENPQYKVTDSTVKHYANTIEELMAMAIRQEPSLASLKYNVAVASAEVDATISDLMPSISLSFDWRASGRNPGLPWLWQLSGAASMTETLFNGGRNLRAVESAVLSLRQARSIVASKEQQIYRNLRVALLTSARAKKSYEVAKLSEKSARENLEIVNQKFALGEASSVDRTDAQVSYSTARAEAVSAFYDFEESHAAVAYLIGE